MTPAYPLQWPAGWARSKTHKSAKFGKSERQTNDDGNSWHQRRDLTMADAMKRVAYELGRLGVERDDFVVSTNLRLNMQGLPRQDQGEPADRGVAVYWQRKGKPQTVIAVDLYDRVRDNLAAVAATLRAMRDIARHGGARLMERAFTGFTALPSATEGAPPSCWEILDVPPGAAREAIVSKFRELAKNAHPTGQTSARDGGRERAFRIRGEPGDVVVYDERWDPHRPHPRGERNFRSVMAAMLWIAEELMQEPQPPSSSTKGDSALSPHTEK